MRKIKSKISGFLNQPFPYHLRPWLKVFVASFFVAILMLLFRPQYMVKDIKYPSLIMAGYGVVSFVAGSLVYFVLPLFFRTFFDPERWTMGKQLIHQMMILVTVSVANFIYTLAFTNFAWDGLYGFMIVFAMTLGVAGLLFLGFNMLSINLDLKSGLQNAQELNEVLKKNAQRVSQNQNQSASTSQVIEFPTEGRDDDIKAEVKDLLFLEAEGNYVNIYIAQNDEVVVKKIRSTFGKVQTIALQYEELMKCHRSFMVNVNYITNLVENAKSYRLQLSKSGLQVPVSRGYIKEFKQSVLEATQ